MNLKEKIDQDLKTALLAGDKTLVTTLRGLKNAILYAEVAAGKRSEGLEDSQIVEVLSKERKKRLESTELYQQAGETAREAQETAEAAVIEAYLPKQLSEPEITSLVDGAIAELSATSVRDMGQVINRVKQQTVGGADPSKIARLVKEKLEST